MNRPLPDNVLRAIARASDGRPEKPIGMTLKHAASRNGKPRPERPRKEGEPWVGTGWTGEMTPGSNVRVSGRSKLQSAYAEELELRRHAGELLDVVEEGISLRLADRTWYRPDFLLRFPDGHLEIHEAKGHWEDDARVKIKVAAELHGWARFVAVTRRKGEGGFGGWALEAIPGPRFQAGGIPPPEPALGDKLNRPAAARRALHRG